MNNRYSNFSSEWEKLEMTQMLGIYNNEMNLIKDEEYNITTKI